MAIPNTRKRLIAGNWKMNGNIRSIDELSEMSKSCDVHHCEVIICPPAILLSEAKQIMTNTSIKIGAQNCHYENSGAFTGEISAEMLVNLGIEAVILGHSERRQHFFEKDDLIKSKARSANNQGLTSIICIGETSEEKHLMQTDTVVINQLRTSLPETFSHSNTVIAYEPVWAIGTGKTPTADEIADVHYKIREYIAKVSNAETSNSIRIIYGGSVNPKNAKDILSVKDVDGALVGGASLLEKDFSRIITATEY